MTKMEKILINLGWLRGVFFSVTLIAWVLPLHAEESILNKTYDKTNYQAISCCWD